jgi:hypothetical protein
MNPQAMTITRITMNSYCCQCLMRWLSAVKSNNSERWPATPARQHTSNQAERDIRPVKVQQHISGGTWRTLLSLADFATVQSYLSTTARWGIEALDVLTQLFTNGPLVTARNRPHSTAPDRRPHHAHSPTSAPTSAGNPS